MVYKHSQGTSKALTRHVRKNLYCKLKVIYTTYIKFLYKLLQAQQVSLSPKLIYKHNPNRSEACSAVLALQLLPLHRVWCHGHCCYTAHGVAGIVVVPHMVSWVLSSRRVGVATSIISPHVKLRELLSCHVWCCSGCHHAVCGVGGTVIAPCGCCSCHHHTV